MVIIWPWPVYGAWQDFRARQYQRHIKVRSGMDEFKIGGFGIFERSYFWKVVSNSLSLSLCEKSCLSKTIITKNELNGERNLPTSLSIDSSKIASPMQINISSDLRERLETEVVQVTVDLLDEAMSEALGMLIDTCRLCNFSQSRYRTNALKKIDQGWYSKLKSKPLHNRRG